MDDFSYSKCLDDPRVFKYFMDRDKEDKFLIWLSGELSSSEDADQYLNMVLEMRAKKPAGVAYLGRVCNYVNGELSAHMESRIVLLDLICGEPKRLLGSLGAMLEHAKKTHNGAWCNDNLYCALKSGLNGMGEKLRNELSALLIDLGINFTWTDEDLTHGHVAEELSQNKKTALKWEIEKTWVLFWIKRQCGPNKYVDTCWDETPSIFIYWKSDGLRIAECYIQNHNNLPTPIKPTGLMDLVETPLYTSP